MLCYQIQPIYLVELCFSRVIFLIVSPRLFLVNKSNISVSHNPPYFTSIFETSIEFKQAFATYIHSIFIKSQETTLEVGIHQIVYI